MTGRLRADLFAFYADLSNRAKSMSKPEIKDMNPATIENLKSIGYIR